MEKYRYKWKMTQDTITPLCTESNLNIIYKYMCSHIHVHIERIFIKLNLIKWWYAVFLHHNNILLSLFIRKAAPVHSEMSSTATVRLNQTRNKNSIQVSQMTSRYPSTKPESAFPQSACQQEGDQSYRRRFMKSLSYQTMASQ